MGLKLTERLCSHVYPVEASETIVINGVPQVSVISIN